MTAQRGESALAPVALHAEFEAAMNSGTPIVDNAGTWRPLGHLEGDLCACGARIPGDVDACEDCAWIADEWTVTA